jgi:hypothetical protein
VSFIVCVVSCDVFRLIVVLFCVTYVICLSCLILLPLPPGKDPFAVKINNNLDGLLWQYTLTKFHHDLFWRSRNTKNLEVTLSVLVMREIYEVRQ